MVFFKSTAETIRVYLVHSPLTSDWLESKIKFGYPKDHYLVYKDNCLSYYAQGTETAIEKSDALVSLFGTSKPGWCKLAKRAELSMLMAESTEIKIRLEPISCTDSTDSMSSPDSPSSPSSLDGSDSSDSYTPFNSYS